MGVDTPYSLFAVVVHVGSGPNHGHYFAIVRASPQHWLCFDDDVVDVVDKKQMQAYFGSATETQASTETGYLLFYERAEEEAPTSDDDDDGDADDDADEADGRGPVT